MDYYLSLFRTVKRFANSISFLLDVPEFLHLTRDTKIDSGNTLDPHFVLECHGAAAMD